MNIQGFEVPDEILEGMRARGESCKVCSGCGLKIGASRDSRKDWYCDICSQKVSQLKRYSHPGYNPTPEEKKRIFASLTRAGR